MAVDPTEEWQRLTALYAEMGDLELLELKDAFEDLTDGAQSILSAELKRRQLWEVASPAKGEILEPARKTQRAPREALLLGGVTIRAYDTPNEAKLAVYVLELAGIQAVEAEGYGNFDLRQPCVRVAPADVDRSDAILSEPISPEIRAEHEAMLNTPDFEVPLCPQCHSSDDVLLEAFEPNNQWVCDHCGHRWEDAIATG
jgi:hypothetical protein